jgi:hypothetical protein
MTFDDIKNTLIQAIAVGSIIEVHGGEEGGLSADTYAFGAPTAFRGNREWLIIYFQNGEARFPTGGVVSITEKHSGEWVERC